MKYFSDCVERNFRNLTKIKLKKIQSDCKGPFSCKKYCVKKTAESLLTFPERYR